MAEKKELAPQHQYGSDQNVKMELMELVHSAKSPYLIIYRLACYLEEISAEPGYALHVRDNLRSVYGCALGQKVPLQDELADVEARLKRIEKARAEGDFTEEEIIRIDFAIAQHKRNIARLKTLIEKSENDGEQLFVEN